MVCSNRVWYWLGSCTSCWDLVSVSPTSLTVPGKCSQVIQLDIIAVFHSVKLCFSDLFHVYLIASSHGLVWFQAMVMPAYSMVALHSDRVCGFQVPSTLGPVMYLSWLRNELWELWEGSGTILNEKARLLEV